MIWKLAVKNYQDAPAHLVSQSDKLKLRQAIRSALQHKYGMQFRRRAVSCFFFS